MVGRRGLGRGFVEFFLSGLLGLLSEVGRKKTKLNIYSGRPYGVGSFIGTDDIGSVKSGSRQWDLELIEDLFDSRDVELIKQSVNGSWNSSMEDYVWKMLWKIKAPPKLWGRVNFHVLVQCPFAHSCWLRSALGVDHSTVNNFFDWFMEVLAVGNMGLVKEAVMVGWAIWKAQNDMLWNGRSCSAADVIWLAHTTLRQWTTAQSNRLGSVSQAANRTDTRDYWSKPAASQLKINVDGVVFEDINEIGTGFVAHDCDGHVMEAFSTISSVSCRPEIAEILSVKEALSWIKRNNKSNVISETDCILVVQAILSSLNGLLTKPHTV
ncbi:uncharacterized protein LOC133033111 [Cannabis sativa]|uniref:uncharacterized protein LOC133033111 n=1 Tax=Cannabis sativa TaxID=3483 RepID=UPI0029CA540D|nr:uncharacterized protein LOC133033111 [Cannabis sativa]